MWTKHAHVPLNKAARVQRVSAVREVNGVVFLSRDTFRELGFYQGLTDDAVFEIFQAPEAVRLADRPSDPRLGRHVSKA